MSAAIAYLRRRTVWRSLHTYRVWVGRAIGWWSILYLIFWLVVFALSGAEMVTTLAQPLPVTVPIVAALLVALLFLGLLTSGRAPSVVLDRRDLFRAALAPSVPWDVIRYRMNVRRSLIAVAAAVVGGLWSFIAPHYFHVSAPWAAPAAALVGVTYFDVGWLRYAGHRRDDAVGAAARAVASGVVVAFVVTSAVGAWLGYVTGITESLASFAIAAPLAALTESSPFVLVVPGLLALVTNAAVRRSLQSSFPPRFAAQSLVLTQLQAMRTFQVLAGIAGVRGGQEADAGERARLLAALHDRPGATRPRRSLKPPGLDQPAWRAIAWRTASDLHRRPRFAQVRAVLLTISAATALLAAAQVMSAAQPVAPTGPVLDGVGAAASAPTSFAGTFVGALGVLLAAFLTARAGAGLVGPGLIRSGLPITASDRSRGRTVPALVVFAFATLVALPLLAVVRSATGGTVPDPASALTTLMAYGCLLLTCLVALEKYSSWSGAPVGRWEPQVVAALVVALPMLVLVAFGAPGWVMPVQFFLLAVVWLIDV